MDIKPLKPRRGDGTLRIDDSDDLVVIENIDALPKGNSMPESGVYIENHGVIIICTDGNCRLNYYKRVLNNRLCNLFCNAHYIIKVAASVRSLGCTNTDKDNI